MGEATGTYGVRYLSSDFINFRSASFYACRTAAAPIKMQPARSAQENIMQKASLCLSWASMAMK